MKPQKSWIGQAIAWVKQGSGAPAPSDQPEATPPPAGERRREERLKTAFDAVLSVAGGSLPVQGIDLHKHGARVLSPMLLPPGSVIFVHLKAQGLVGFGHVRHCTQHGRSFSVGLEFPGELMPKEDGPWNYQRVSAS